MRGLSFATDFGIQSLASRVVEIPTVEILSAQLSSMAEIESGFGVWYTEGSLDNALGVNCAFG